MDNIDCVFLLKQDVNDEKRKKKFFDFFGGMKFEEFTKVFDEFTKSTTSAVATILQDEKASAKDLAGQYKLSDLHLTMLEAMKEAEKLRDRANYTASATCKDAIMDPFARAEHWEAESKEVKYRKLVETLRQAIALLSADSSPPAETSTVDVAGTIGVDNEEKQECKVPRVVDLD